MHRRALTTAAVTAAALLTLASCNPKPEAISAPTTAATTPTAAPSVSTAPAASKAGPLPNLIGKGLQSAQDTAQAAGFFVLKSHDALGRGRHQILDRDWKVCTQTPAAGTRPVNGTVDLGAVKLAESCPSTDTGTSAPKAGALMPNFRGKALSTARAALDSSTSISTDDVSGQSRMIIVESNWQVCSQSPAAGTTLTGQPVAFKAVKFGEDCP